MEQQYIVSSYADRDGRGLYQIAFETDTGYFQEPTVIMDLSQIEYHTLSKNRQLLFVLYSKPAGSGLVAFGRNADNGWNEIHRIQLDSQLGYHLCYHDDRQCIYIAGGGTGQIHGVQLKEGQLSHIQSLDHTGSGPHPDQDRAHIHYVGHHLNPDILYACDFGSDRVYAYQVLEDGTLALAGQLDLPEETGPRHMVFHPHRNYAYINGELNNTTNVLHLGSQGKMTFVESYQNIPDEFLHNARSATLKISQDGRHLYVTTRFYNDITAFQVSEAGDSLLRIAKYHTVGQIPRDFTIDDSENYILIPHQASDHITVFKRNPETGFLDFINNEAYLPECICIKQLL